MSQKDIIFPVLESIKIRCRLHTILQYNMPLHVRLTTCGTRSYTAIQTVLSFGHIDGWAVEVDAWMSLTSLSRFVFLGFGVYICTFTSTLDQPSMDPWWWSSCNETRQDLFWSYNYLLFKFFHVHEDCYDMYCIVILYIIFNVPLPHLYTFFNH